MGLKHRSEQACERAGIRLTMSLRKSMSLKEELPLLKARAQAIEARLDLLSRRLSEIQQKPGIPFYIANIDSGRCLGCGVCETVCPVGAIAIKGTALVNEARCVGCGRCADQCPQGAIVLRLYQKTRTVYPAGM
jgi:NAD-dependent dihydropyrimidine dehydrogenase PreA subunit